MPFGAERLVKMNANYEKLVSIKLMLKKVYGVIANFGIHKYNGNPMFIIVSESEEGMTEIVAAKIHDCLRKFGVKGKIKIRFFGNTCN